MKKLTAYDELQRFGAMFKGIMEVADELKEVGGLEQAAAEAVRLRDATLAEIDTLKAEVKKQKDAVAKAKEQVAVVSDQAQQEIAAARQTIAAETDAHAARIREAQDAARIELAALQAQIDMARASVQAQAAVEQARQQAILDDLGSKIKATADELADVEGKLEKARKALAKLGLAVAE